ncbi:reverse transcriptase domain-containing protein [Tanacetum coccineum]
MTTPVEKRKASKFCKFHGEVGHTTDECMHLKRKIKEMLKAGKLSHLIKKLKQSSGKDQAKTAKKGETSRKDKPLAILIVQPWQRVARQRITQTFFPETVISFPHLREEDGTEGPMIIEAEMGGHFVHRITLNFRMDELHGCKVTISLQWNNRKARCKENPSGPVYSPWNAKIHSNRTRSIAARNQPSQGGKDSGGDSPRISRTNRSNSGYDWSSASHSRTQAKWLSNPVMVKKHDDSWRMCVDFKDLNKACPKDGYPLPEIDWKVESLCGYPFKCFLDAYKGYHQIKMAKEDEEKTAFITSQGILCYSKMPFGLKNARATYQRLVDKAFQKQIGQNLEAYVDDLVIKSCTEQEIIRDIEETFKTLREINMKLNLKKCTFGMREGTFLGYKVNADGLKDVQKLNGKLASLNRFMSKSAEKSLPFFKTLKKCTKKSDFQWIAEAEMAFKQMKKLIAELPMLTAPKEKEELIIYLAAAKEAISAVLMTERDGEQMPIYFVSRALQGPEINYTPMEKLILALILFTDGSSCIDGSESGLILTSPEGMELTYALSFTHLSKQVLVEELKEKSIDEKEVLAVVEEEGHTWMTPIYEYLTEEILPEEKKKARSIHRKAGRYAMTNRVLYKRSFLGPWLRCVGPLQANYVLREIHEGSCSMHAGPRSMVAKALRSGHYWPTIHADARKLIRECSDCQVHRPVPRNPQQNLTPITSPWLFYKWGIDIAGPFLEGPGKVKFLIVAMDYFTKWIEAKLVATKRTGQEVCVGQHSVQIRLARRNSIRQREAVQGQPIQRLALKAMYPPMLHFR